MERGGWGAGSLKEESLEHKAKETKLRTQGKGNEDFKENKAA